MTTQLDVAQSSRDYLADFVPDLGNLDEIQTAIPRLARDVGAISRIEEAVRLVPTNHVLHLRDARDLSPIESDSVHLVVTSPPYWTLKQYRPTDGQLGHVDDYAEFLEALDHVWAECFRVLVPGGRVVCVVGDVLLSRRSNGGRHTVVPLHAAIQEHCRLMGFDNLAPIIWNKIGNARYEAGGGGFLGKPYEPNAIVKNDIEYILFQRKPGAYRKPTIPMRLLSIISTENHQRWFQQIWQDVNGASTREHPAPFPVTLAERLVRMFSFVGDTVLDPFLGTASTSVAAATWGRNSVGVEIDPHYLEIAEARLDRYARDLFSKTVVEVIR